MFAKLATHGITGAIAEEESHGLDYGHHAESDAHGAGLRGTETSDEERVGQAVDGGYEIGDDCRDGEPDDQ